MKLLALLFLLAAAAFAADIDGNWKATADGPNGTMERTFAFKSDGSKLSGETVSSLVGKSTIKNGKVEGNKITFDIDISVDGNAATVSYKGTFDGDSIKLTSEAGGNTFSWTGERVQ